MLIYIDIEHYFSFLVFMDDKKNEKMATVSLPRRAARGDGGRERGRARPPSIICMISENKIRLNPLFQ